MPSRPPRRGGWIPRSPRRRGDAAPPPHRYGHVPLGPTAEHEHPTPPHYQRSFPTTARHPTTTTPLQTTHTLHRTLHTAHCNAYLPRNYCAVYSAQSCCARPPRCCKVPVPVRKINWVLPDPHPSEIRRVVNRRRGNDSPRPKGAGTSPGTRSVACDERGHPQLHPSSYCSRRGGGWRPRKFIMGTTPPGGVWGSARGLACAKWCAHPVRRTLQTTHTVDHTL